VALLPLGFFVSLLSVITLTAEVFKPMWAALTLCYATAFMGVAARWFWGRWFASGLSWSGVGLGLVLLVHPQTPAELTPIFLAYTIMHATVIACLMGARMAARYELQAGWRERFSVDEYGVSRLGKAVTRASACLPGLIMWALGPGEGGQGLHVGGLVAFMLGACGVAAMLRLRTWGAIALALAGVVIGVVWLLGGGTQAYVAAPDLISDFARPALADGLVSSPITPVFTLAVLGWALLPLARPAWRFLRG